MARYEEQQAVIEDLNTLSDYEGYIQFSNDALEVISPTEIRLPKQIDAFIVEAHYSNGKRSVTVHYINGAWYWDETDVSKIGGEEKRRYKAKYEKDVILSQIWTEEKEEYCTESISINKTSRCNSWEVEKLQKVVFAGFADTTGGES